MHGKLFVPFTFIATVEEEWVGGLLKEVRVGEE